MTEENWRKPSRGVEIDWYKSPKNVEIARGLHALFPNCGIDIIGDNAVRCITVNAPPGESVYLKFQQLAALAKVLGTEQIDFTCSNGADVADSVTWDGVLFQITARYGKPAYEREEGGDE